MLLLSLLSLLIWLRDIIFIVWKIILLISGLIDIVENVIEYIKIISYGIVTFIENWCNIHIFELLL